MILINDILEIIDYLDYNGESDKKIKSIISLDNVEQTTDALSWCSDKHLEKLAMMKTSSIIIVSKNAESKYISHLNCLIVENPRRIFQEILTNFFLVKRAPKIEKTAIIEKDCVLGRSVYIGHNVVIEKGCKIGNNVVIFHNTVIHEGTTIGNFVTIGSNNTIGGVGFGYEKNNHGDFEIIPHIGDVIIKNFVDIGNNTCVDRAVLGSTILEENVKIDNLVHIAHGVHVGRNTLVVANAMVAGSVNIGENSWIAPSSSILNKMKIGNNSLVSLGAVVLRNVEDDTIVYGNPARRISK